jgi:carbamoylphosphate synthase small subunit
MFDAATTAIQPEALPFPYNKSAFCRYEPIEKRIDHAKVLIVNDLLRYESDLSPLAKKDWNGNLKSRLEFERKVAGMACDNIAKNVQRLVKNPKSMTVHLSEVADAADKYRPDAIVMSGTYADFDYYNPAHIESFRSFIKQARIPVLAICGAHQLVGMSFGADLRTLDDL